VIKLVNVNLAYNGKAVLEDFSLEIKTGAKVVILGKSGLGKSSLFSLILGFTTPNKGKIFFDGSPVDKKSIWGIRKKVAYVDQDVSIADGNVSSWLDFVFHLKANGFAGFDRKKVKDFLDFFELDVNVLGKDTSELSGGEKQRLAIIVSILLERKVFLLDEVTSSLDKHLKKKVINYFIERDDCIVIAISHDSGWLDNPRVGVFDLEAGKWRQ
jgi:putative ABC transport system ATP-binding protein